MLYIISWTIQNRPSWTQVVRVLDGAEPEIFTQWSSSWTVSSSEGGKTKKRSRKPKLFNCSDEKGDLVIEEIANFGYEVLFLCVASLDLFGEQLFCSLKVLFIIFIN